MRILLLGNGGREHALAWKMAQSPMLGKLFIAPGNAGTSSCGENVNLNPMNFWEVKTFVLEMQINMVVVGPEDPLASGIVDFFRADTELKNVAILGPDKAGAQLESSKDFGKVFMQKYRIPTAGYRSFLVEEMEEAKAYISNHSLPIVMKADGLAAGKGVAICASAEEAFQFLDEVWNHDKFGSSGQRIVIEEFLTGVECSVFVLTDGTHYILLPEAKDYKRIGEGDTGANTGGMGSISPVPFANALFMEKVTKRIIIPTMQGLKTEGIDYRGFIFFGLIKVNDEPFVIEYNCRMGDPETQVVMPRIAEDIVPYFFQAAKGSLNSNVVKFSTKHAAAVIAVSGGYPEAYEKGKAIKGLENVEPDSTIFSAGATEKDGEIITNGGRVLAMVSLDDSLEKALQTSYKNLNKICFEGMTYRKDIGGEFVKSPQKN